jgi:hypothetical protein
MSQEPKKESVEEVDPLWQDIYATIAYSLAASELQDKPQSEAIANATNDIYEKFVQSDPDFIAKIVGETFEAVIEKDLSLYKVILNSTRKC